MLPTIEENFPRGGSKLSRAKQQKKQENVSFFLVWVVFCLKYTIDLFVVIFLECGKDAEKETKEKGNT